jgi:hypothetical protein
VRVCLVGHCGQQFDDVIPGIQPIQIDRRALKPPFQFRFRQLFLDIGFFEQEHFSTDLKHVMGTLEGTLHPASTLRQSRYLAKVTGHQCHNAAGLAEFDNP